jgi:hypothetical protein
MFNLTDERRLRWLFPLTVASGALSYYSWYWFSRPVFVGLAVFTGLELIASCWLIMRGARLRAEARRAAFLEREMWRSTLPPKPGESSRPATWAPNEEL